MGYGDGEEAQKGTLGPCLGGAGRVVAWSWRRGGRRLTRRGVGTRSQSVSRLACRFSMAGATMPSIRHPDRHLLVRCRRRAVGWFPSSETLAARLRCAPPCIPASCVWRGWGRRGGRCRWGWLRARPPRWHAQRWRERLRGHNGRIVGPCCHGLQEHGAGVALKPASGRAGKAAGRGETGGLRAPRAPHWEGREVDAYEACEFKVPQGRLV